MIARMLGNAAAVDATTLDKNYGKLLVEGEAFEIGFKVIRDIIIFTNKRLLMVDKQGITGKKQEFLTIPYGKITKFSLETAGRLDMDADLKIWVGSESQPITKDLGRKVDAMDLQRVLATHILT